MRNRPAVADGKISSMNDEMRISNLKIMRERSRKKVRELKEEIVRSSKYRSDVTRHSKRLSDLAKYRELLDKANEDLEAWGQSNPARVAAREEMRQLLAELAAAGESPALSDRIEAARAKLDEL